MLRPNNAPARGVIRSANRTRDKEAPSEHAESAEAASLLAQKLSQTLPDSFRRLFTTAEVAHIQSVFEAEGALRRKEQIERTLLHFSLFPNAKQFVTALEQVNFKEGVPLSFGSFLELIQRLFFASLIQQPSDTLGVFDAVGDGQSVKGSTLNQLLHNFDLEAGTGRGVGVADMEYGDFQQWLQSDEPTEDFIVTPPDDYAAFEKAMQACVPPPSQYVQPGCGPQEQGLLRGRRPSISQQPRSAGAVRPVYARGTRPWALDVMMRENPENPNNNGTSNPAGATQGAAGAKVQQGAAARGAGQGRATSPGKIPVRSKPKIKLEDDAELEGLGHLRPKTVMMTLRQTLSRGNCHIDLTEPVPRLRRREQNIRREIISSIELRAAMLAAKSTNGVNATVNRRTIVLRKHGKKKKWRRVFSDGQSAQKLNDSEEEDSGDEVDYSVLDPRRPGNMHLLAQLKPHQLRSRLYMITAVARLMGGAGKEGEEEKNATNGSSKTSKTSHARSSTPPAMAQRMNTEGAIGADGAIAAQRDENNNNNNNENNYFNFNINTNTSMPGLLSPASLPAIGRPMGAELYIAGTQSGIRYGVDVPMGVVQIQRNQNMAGGLDYSVAPSTGGVGMGWGPGSRAGTPLVPQLLRSGVGSPLPTLGRPPTREQVEDLLMNVHRANHSMASRQAQHTSHR